MKQTAKALALLLLISGCLAAEQGLRYRSPGSTLLSDLVVANQTVAAELPEAPAPRRASDSASRDGVEETASASKKARLPRPRYPDVLIADVPHIRQKPDFCGEACAAMWLRRLGQPVDQDYVFDMSGLAPIEGRGCYTRELVRALQRIGFDPGPVWYEAPNETLETSLEAVWRRVHGDLQQGIPSIVCTYYDDQPETTEHFRLILGYDGRTDEVIYHEPATLNGAYRRMSLNDFFELWPLKYDEDRRTVIRLRLASGRLRQGTTSTALTDADYAQHMIWTKPKIPSDEFTVIFLRPFVVIGDEPESQVRGHADGTIRWAIGRLKQDYFAKDPNQILNIWLFKDKDSYEKNVEEIFGEPPSTPYGYFSRRHQALVMNIETGTGTLVHELVHPFVAANFPRCPAWFNEGLASLYEQCHDSRGRIEGRTNWRLQRLQKAIEGPEEKDEDEDEDEDVEEEEDKEDEEILEKVCSFEELCSMSDWEFYGSRDYDTYAQARYLCYYLEQHRLLRTYYRRFVENHRADPTGYATLKSVLGREDMEAFQEEWQEYVMRLTYP